jgi:aspartate/methionine/tyrosine aminotransferase
MSPGPSRRTALLPPLIARRLFDARRPTSINLGVGDPAEPVSHDLLDAGVARYRSTRQGYTQNSGMVELREKIAKYHAFPYLGESRNVVVTVGATGGFFATLLAVTDPGDEVIVADPSFWIYRTIAGMLGARAVSVPLDRERGMALDVPRIVAAITPRTRAVILNSPSNPTGHVDSEEDVRALVEATESAGIWLISDEIYRELSYLDAPPCSVGDSSARAIVIGALSKSCSMTGFRLGYVLAPDTIVTAIAATHKYNVTSAPTISQCLALEAFENVNHMKSTRHHYVKRRAAMMEALEREVRLPYVRPDGGFFVFLDVRSLRLPSLTLAERLLEEADVVTVPGIAFGESSDGFLRLSFCESEENIVEGVRRLGKWIRHR